jgi:hypothetical protein
MGYGFLFKPFNEWMKPAIKNIFKEKKWGNLKTFVTGQFQID